MLHGPLAACQWPLTMGLLHALKKLSCFNFWWSGRSSLRSASSMSLLIAAISASGKQGEEEACSKLTAQAKVRSTNPLYGWVAARLNDATSTRKSLKSALMTSCLFLILVRKWVNKGMIRVTTAGRTKDMFCYKGQLKLFTQISNRV